MAALASNVREQVSDKILLSAEGASEFTVQRRDSFRPELHPISDVRSVLSADRSSLHNLSATFMATTQVERTPNPNSLKFTTDDGSFLQDGVAAYSSATEAQEDPLARRL
ncbi:MAG: NifU N-terminal domain-containing protein, partial [Salinibacter sp.]